MYQSKLQTSSYTLLAVLVHIVSSMLNLGQSHSSVLTTSLRLQRLRSKTPNLSTEIHEKQPQENCPCVRYGWPRHTFNIDGQLKNAINITTLRTSPQIYAINRNIIFLGYSPIYNCMHALINVWNDVNQM